MLTPDVRRVLLLAEVARHGSITAAAEALCYTPSAISQQMTRLEREIGQPVLERHPRGTSLTEAGQVLVTHAERMSRELEEATAELVNLERLHAGCLRIGTFPTAASSLLPPVVLNFSRQHPGVQVVVRSASNSQLLTMLEKRQVELALMCDYEWRRVPETNLEVVPLALDPTVLVVAKSHTLAGCDSTDVRMLKSERWVVRANHPMTEVLVRSCRAAGFEPKLAHEASDFQEVQALVAMGLGVALAPLHGLVAVRDDVMLLVPQSVAAHRRVVLGYVRGRGLSPAALVTKKLLLSAASSWSTTSVPSSTARAKVS